MKSRPVPPQTVHQHLAWAYANLARADAALRHGVSRYGTVHHVIRAKLYKGLGDGTMSLGSLVDDERVKLLQVPRCGYCGSEDHLAIDHVMPKARGAGDWPENLVLACRSFNSSKRDRDMIGWLLARGDFHPLMLLRRYLKLAFAVSTENEWLALDLTALPALSPPWDPTNFPLHFPDLPQLRH